MVEPRANGLRAAKVLFVTAVDQEVAIRTIITTSGNHNCGRSGCACVRCNFVDRQARSVWPVDDSFYKV
jgi:hypothetical protein